MVAHLVLLTTPSVRCKYIMSISISGSNISGGMNYTVNPGAQGSVSLNGINQALIYDYTDQFNLATGNPDFTIESWFYIRQLPGYGWTYYVINNGGTSGTSYSQYQIYITATGLIYASLGTAGGASGGFSDTYIGTGTIPIVINNWYHIALVRNGNYATVYLNGQPFGSLYLGTTFYPDSFRSASAPTYIGAFNGGGGSSYQNLYGYISNVRIVKYASVYNPNFTIPTSPLTAVSGTSLLLDVSSSGTYLTDGSTNNYTVVSTGSVPYSSSTPISSGGSLSFNGTSQYLTIPSATAAGTPLDLSTNQGDFTVECWFNANNLTLGGNAKQPMINYGWQENVVNPSYGIFIYNQNLQFMISDGIVSGSYLYYQLPVSRLSNNVWYHIAMVRTGNNLLCFLNGNLESVKIITFNMGPGSYGNGFAIGTQSAATPYAFYDGYLTNIRIVKGIAVYNSNFTPPNRPFAILQTANSNGNPSNLINGPQTSFLLNTPNNSTYLNNGSIYTITGTQATSLITQKALIPAITSTSISPFSGSVLFNGTTQSLTAPTNTAFGYATGVDFTIEMWIYVTAINGASNMSLIDSRPASTQGLYTTLFINTSGNIVYYTNSANRITSDSTVSINTWYHVALVRLSGSTTLYLNGTQTGSSYADTNTYVASAQQIGASYNATAALTTFFNGYISNLRIVNGVGVYTTTFTPSTTTLPSTQSPRQFGTPSAGILSKTQTSLLLKTTFDTNFLVDYSNNSATITNNGTATSSALSPFSGNYAILSNPGSVLFNGSTQYLTVPSNAALAFSTGDYTLEFWVYFTVAPSGIVCLYNTLNNNFFFQYNPGLGFQTGIVGVAATTTFAFTVTANTWYHVAVSRNSSTTQCWVNGNTIGTPQTDSTDYGQTGAQVAGLSGGQLLTGYISNLRVVKGVAIYTSAFTPPAGPLQSSQVANQSGAPSAAVTSSQTSLLLNTSYGTSFLQDSSVNNFTVTNVGTATSTTLDPFVFY